MKTFPHTVVFQFGEPLEPKTVGKVTFLYNIESDPTPKKYWSGIVRIGGLEWTFAGPLKMNAASATRLIQECRKAIRHRSYSSADTK